MHLNRVPEIINAPNNIKVLYNNNPVWIEGINQQDATAYVTILGKNQQLEVPVSELNEAEENLRL